MLLRGCCCVRSTPDVWPWNLNLQQAGSFAPSRSRAILAQMRRPARNFATSSKKRDRDVEEKREATQHVIHIHAACNAVFGILNSGRKRESHRLSRCRASLLHMLADDRNRIPVRNMAPAKFDVVQQDPARSGQRQTVELVIGDKMRNVVALIGRTRHRAPIDAAAPRHAECEGEQGKGRRVVHRSRRSRRLEHRRGRRPCGRSY